MCSKFRVCSRLLPDVVEATRYRLFDDHAILRNACLCAGFGRRDSAELTAIHQYTRALRGGERAKQLAGFQTGAFDP